MASTVGPVIGETFTVGLLRRGMQVSSRNAKLAVDEDLPLRANPPHEPTVQNLVVSVAVNDHVTGFRFGYCPITVFPENPFHLFGENQKLAAQKYPTMTVGLGGRR